MMAYLKNTDGYKLDFFKGMSYDEIRPIFQARFDANMREDLEDLWGIVKERFSTSKPSNFSDEYLLTTLKIMFEKPDGQDAVWRSQNSVHGQALPLELMLLKRSRKNTKCVNATDEDKELTAVKHKLMLLILNSKGAISSKTAADAKVAIQEMVEYSQKWHNGTSRIRSTKTSDGLAAIQAQLNNLGRKIKKVNEKVYAAQVGCEQCKGPYYTKDFPLKEEGKTLAEAYYTQFGGPYQGGGYREATLGFYQRNNANPPFLPRTKEIYGRNPEQVYE
nr:hypothetical protein [Tanacetum cinerariifolium]